ncbi:protein VACUOLELESS GAMETOPHYTES-like [Magnolia sinica]|uniref:protein VACUOLELESS GAMETOPHYTES-like n=1 Tax=Magnolia sinica TaxID=86752 RepID=UPI00265A1421|nr:protein VACUOLELESS GAMETOPHYTES-like [Magnolia sinica]
MPCNYHLHKDCALATPYTFHPFFEDCNFKFFTRPPGKLERCCDACGRNVQGFVYHCEKCGNDLHPCCAQLPRVIGDDKMKLHLHHKVKSNCHRCGWMKVRKKERSWSYVSTSKEYCFHVSCVKDMLVEEWEKEYFGHDHEEVGKNGLALQIKVPKLQLSVPNNKGANGKFNKYWNIIKVAIQVIISILVGDPTALVGGLITSVITSAFSP